MEAELDRVPRRLEAFPLWLAREILRDNLASRGRPLEDSVRGDGKVCIVTGSNTGIGKEICRELAKRGCTVYMACRNLEKGNKARTDIIADTLNERVHCEECDLADLESVHKFVNNFKKKESKLNILINNAGVMRCPRMLTKQGIELQLGVNHMGHFLLTNLLLENLMQGAPSRIINVSSSSHSRGTINFEDLNSEQSYDPEKAYNQSKLANICFTVELAERMKGTGVNAYAVHPGIVKTEITRHMGFEDSMLASLFTKPLLGVFLKSPTQGASISVFAALEPSLGNSTGMYYRDCKETQLDEEARNMTVAKRLWAISEKWTGLSNAPSNDSGTILKSVL